MSAGEMPRGSTVADGPPRKKITADSTAEPWAHGARRDHIRPATSSGRRAERLPDQSSLSRPTRVKLSSSRQISGAAGIAVLIAVATALASHLIGTGRGVPAALIDDWRLGPRGTIAVELAYYVAAGVAAAAAVVIFTLLTKRAGDEQRVRRGIRIAVAVATVMVCFVVPDFAVGGSPVGAYTSRGAYEFVSAPGLHPPIVRVDLREPGRLANGYIFMANFYNTSDPPMVGQSGPLILDQRLSPVWFKPIPEDDLAANLSLQTYEGRPVLAWWQGQDITDSVPASQEYVVVDQHYRPVAVLRGADGWVLTLHDFVIRGQDAWVTASKTVPVNLLRYGGARNGAVVDCAVQEYSLKTGKLIRSWDALDHVPLSDSYSLRSTSNPWDAYHLNSIDLPGDGTFVVSMRNTWAAYKVNIATGRIEWTLGGKHSSFEFAAGAGFEWQHNVMVYPGTPFVTLFDDACCQVTAAGKRMASGPSRGLVLRLEPRTHTAIVADQYTEGPNFHSEFMGDMEPLPGGNEFVGWGSQPRFSEFTASGRMLLDAVLPGPDITYRANVEPWVGLPLYPPSGAARQHGRKTTVYASWNGATQVVSWRVLAGSTGHGLVLATAPKVGFETAIAVPSAYRTFRVQGLDERGHVIGTSSPFAVSG
jgi:Arylsulfotransferase (ASST)